MFGERFQGKLIRGVLLLFWGVTVYPFELGKYLTFDYKGEL